LVKFPAFAPKNKKFRKDFLMKVNIPEGSLDDIDFFYTKFVAEFRTNDAAMITRASRQLISLINAQIDYMNANIVTQSEHNLYPHTQV